MPARGDKPPRSEYQREVARAKRDHLGLTMLAHIRDVRLPEPVREHRFHPTRLWRFDFAWTAARVALEVEGGTFSGGRHTRGVGYEGDARKYSEAAIAGWCVVRATAAMVHSGEALTLVERALRSRGVMV